MYHYLISGSCNQVALFVRGFYQNSAICTNRRYHEAIKKGFSKWFASEDSDTPWQ